MFKPSGDAQFPFQVERFFQLYKKIEAFILKLFILFYPKLQNSSRIHLDIYFT